MKDLFDNAENKGYLTRDEINDGTGKDSHKIQQALARSTNDILVSM